MEGKRGRKGRWNIQQSGQLPSIGGEESRWTRREAARFDVAMENGKRRGKKSNGDGGLGRENGAI